MSCRETYDITVYIFFEDMGFRKAGHASGIYRGVKIYREI